MTFVKKAQIAGQVFIYVAAAMLFVLIIIFGYRAINNFLQTAEDVQLAELKADIETGINSIAPTANVERLTLRLPSAFNEICFVDNGYPYSSAQLARNDTPICDPDNDDYRPLVCNAWVSEVKQNVFLVPMADVDIIVNSMKFPEKNGEYYGYLCVKERIGKVQLKLKGRGSHTLVAEWNASVS